MAFGTGRRSHSDRVRARPAAALAVLDALPRRELEEYGHFHLARADALVRLGRTGEAVAAYEAALSRTQNAAQRRHLRSLIAAAATRP